MATFGDDNRTSQEPPVVRHGPVAGQWDTSQNIRLLPPIRTVLEGAFPLNYHDMNKVATDLVNKSSLSSLRPGFMTTFQQPLRPSRSQSALSLRESDVPASDAYDTPDPPPAGLEHLPVLDAEVGRLSGNIFVTPDVRISSARTAQHLSSGAIRKHPQGARTNWQFVYYHVGNIEAKLREEEEQQRSESMERDDEVSKKKRRCNPELGRRPGPVISKRGVVDRRSWTFPLEVWLRILEYAGLRAMVGAMEVHPSLKILLRDKEGLWRNCRKLEYGEDAPGPSPGMTEQQLAMLIAGRGCQAASCPRENSVKVYWAFRCRLCADCYKSKTVKLNDLSNSFQDGPKSFLLHYIQAGVVQGGKYRHCRKVQEDTSDWENDSASKLIFLKDDIAEVEGYYDRGIGGGQTPDEVKAELQNRREEVLQVARSLERIEEWELNVRDTVKHRHDRTIYFIEEAEKLEPPITESALRCMPPFYKALDSNRAPTAEQFKILKSKILPLREEAERIIEVERISGLAWVGMANDDPRIVVYNSIRDRRNGTDKSPEQDHVSDLASQVILEFMEKPIADTDLVLMILREVKRRWSPSSVRGMLVDGRIGPYELSLDDARATVATINDMVLIAGYDSLRKSTILHKFRCPACPRNDNIKRYGFESLFQHLYERHAKLVGDYSRLRVPFVKSSTHVIPWFTLPWSENLPILAHHQQPNSVTDALIWDFDTPQPYQQMQRPSDVSVFHRRIVNPPPSAKPDDFIASILYAGMKLSPTALSWEVQTALAIKYALQSYSTVHSPEDLPSLQVLNSVSDALTRPKSSTLDGEHKLQLRFPCGMCTSDGNISRSSQWVRGPRAFRDLLNHFERDHKQNENSDISWAENLFALPSDTNLRDILDKADTELAKKKREEAAKQKKRREKAKKKISEKVDVVLRTPMAWDVFEELWKEMPESG